MKVKTDGSVTKVANLVFVIESTANMVSHFNQIKKNYIVPLLNYFEPAQGEGNCFESYIRSYAIVLFHSDDKHPGFLTSCYEPTDTKNDFLKQLETIKFVGGGCETQSHIVEGLATAMYCFQDIAEMYMPENNDSQPDKFCFLITNSPPYKANCIENGMFKGLDLNQIGEKLQESNIKLSLITPRHINELRNFFVKVNSISVNLKPNLLNYAHDRRHLVLFHGFNMPTEREPFLLTDELQNSNNPMTAKMEVKQDIKVPTPVNSEGVPSVGMSNIMSPMTNVNTPNSVMSNKMPPQVLTPTSVPYQSPQPVQIKSEKPSTVGYPMNPQQQPSMCEFSYFVCFYVKYRSSLTTCFVTENPFV